MTKFGDYSTQSTIASSDTILFLDQNDASTGKLNQIEWGQLAGRISDGTELNVSHYLTPGQPDGTTDNSTEFQAAIDALPAGGGVIYVPWKASRYLVNIDVPTHVTIKGGAYRNTVLRPYTNANPCIAITGPSARIINLELEGNGAGTSVYGIRSERGVDGAANYLIVEGCTITDFTYGIYINNNYYNTVRQSRISDCTYCFLGRNACNASHFEDIKLTGFDYGIALIAELTGDGGADTYRCHTNYFQNITLEGPSTAGIGFYFKDVWNNVVENPYFEAFHTSSAWPVIEANGPTAGQHSGGDAAAFYQDRAGRNLVSLGVSTGMTIENITDGSTATIATIVNGAAVNDKITCTLAGGSGNEFDDDDYILIDIDNELSGNTYLRNSFNHPHFDGQPAANRFLAGANRIVSNVNGSWASQRDGDLRHNFLSSYAYTANERKEIDLSGTLSSYAAVTLGRVRISYTVRRYGNTPGNMTFRPIGGGANQVYLYKDMEPAATIVSNKVHDGGDDKAYAEDAGENFTNQDVAVGDYLYNITDGCWGIITGISNGGGTNARLEASLAGGTPDFDDGDIFIVRRPGITSGYLELDLDDDGRFTFMASRDCVVSIRIHEILR